MSSDVEPGDGSGNRGAASAQLPVSPPDDEQGPLVGGPEVGCGVVANAQDSERAG